MIDADTLIEWLGADVEDTAQIETLEKAAVAFVQTQTRRYFGPTEAVTVYLVGDGRRFLYLPDPPSEADSDPAFVVTEREYLGADETVLVEDTDFALRVLENEAMLARISDVWTAGYEYEVTYTRGYAPNTEPDDIRQLVIDLVAVRWAQKGREDLRSETIGEYSYTRFGDGDLDAVPGARDTIDAWRRVVVA